ncbi:hypothetical protein Poli38472_001962 [Pythium oligandrum]|uniref:Uncharacterized protein n=1 Tax=Pythium oligandrum TaxID=41045 RepID=A0A8K1CWC2_PYTOL|nr:hypothetical protein Poli38472_001962 [Pythium oligandrum]|eukprot:TMW69806.1 hypothetical protein Poli38472_001962 [Pythium oligandrum]
MSAVELPYVASARSTSSSSSSLSMRRSLHSARSAASHVSSRSLRNNAYNGSEEEEDDEEEYDEEGEEGYQDGEEPHEASGGLWDEVEYFLNKPPPSFAAFAKEDTKPSGNNVLPTLRRERKPVAPSGNQQSSGGKACRPAVRTQATNGAGIKAIDPKLLQEAFAYAEKIQKLNFEDDEEDEQQNEAAASRQRSLLHRDASGSSSSTSGGPRIPVDMLKKQGSMPRTKSREGADQAKKKKTKSASAYGVSVKPQKKKSERALNPTKDSSQWDSDMNGDGGNARKGSAAGSLDPQTVQSLVSNFQNGTTLDELRRELAAAQQSMAMSRQVIQEAAKSFFQTRKS